MNIPSTSSETISAPVSSVLSGQLFDPTTFPVKMAFIPQTTAHTPTATDAAWNTAFWQTNKSVAYASIAVGPGGVTLSAGNYIPWLQISYQTETIIRQIQGFLTIY